MKRRDEQTPVPTARSRTIRQEIIDSLGGAPVTIGQLSREVGLSEKQLRTELESLRKQVRLVITPARCGKCGFEFRERQRTNKPGKCPVCRGTFIEPPLFSLADE